MSKSEHESFLEPLVGNPGSGRFRGVTGATMSGIGAQIATENPGVVSRIIGGTLVVTGIALAWSAGRDADLGKDSTRRMLQRFGSNIRNRSHLAKK